MPGYGVDRGSGSSSGSADNVIAESLIDAKGDLIAGTANDTAARIAVGTDKQRLAALASEATGLVWVSDTQNTVADAKGDLLVGTAADTIARLAVGANEYRLVADSAQTTGLKYVPDTTNYVVAAKGDLLVGTAADTVAALTVGSDDQALLADSSQSTGLRWGGVPSATVRQTQLAGPVTSSGYNNTLSAGAALNFNVDATPTNVVFTFANGFGSGGSVDTYTVLSADATNQGSLNASNTHFIHATRTSATAVTWGQTLIPPDYSYSFDRARGALLNFEAADASTTLVDDFGNTWTASGNAQIDTAQFKFGTASLLLDGTGDFISSSNFTTLGDGSWEASAWFRLNATSAVHAVFALENATGFGVVLSVDHNAGSRRLNLLVSSDGSTNNVVSANGTTTTISLSEWHKVRVVFDSLAGTYRAYLSLAGAAETQEVSVSSTARVCALTKFTLGNSEQATPVEFNGWIDAFRFIRAATNTTTETPTVSAPTITDYPYHWFSIPEMKMYEVTSASASAGTNPGMTQRNRVFVGEADTGAATVSAIRNYALRGQYRSAWTALPASPSSTSHSSNIGVPPELQTADLVVRVTTTEGGYNPGECLRVVQNEDSGGNQYFTAPAVSDTRNTIRAMRAAQGWRGPNKSTGNSFTLTTGQYQVVAQRAF